MRRRYCNDAARRVVAPYTPGRPHGAAPTGDEKRMSCIVGAAPCGRPPNRFMQRGIKIRRARCPHRAVPPMEPKRQGTREARGGKEGKREFDRCERQRAEDAAAPSSCPRRTNSDRFPNVRHGFGNHRGGAPGTQPRPNVVVVVGRGRARERTRNAHAWAFRVKRTL